MTPFSSRRFRPARPVDLATTLAPLRHGKGDPTIRIGAHEVWRATRTPDGPGAARLRADGDLIEVEAWGPGAPWLVERAPALCGDCDDPRGFEPRHDVVRHLHRAYPHLRIGRSDAVVEALIPSILEQKVIGEVARRSYRALIRTFGETAPGPFELMLPPEPARLAALGYHVFHPLGIERRRAETIRSVCAHAGRLEETARMPLEDAYRRLRAIPGVGPWTAALVGGVAFGDADAVEVGDYHVPHNVAWALAGEPRGSDDRMLELLEPYRGHRGRVLRLLGAGGPRPPRYGPRTPIRSIAAI